MGEQEVTRKEVDKGSNANDAACVAAGCQAVAVLGADPERTDVGARRAACEGQG